MPPPVSNPNVAQGVVRMSSIFTLGALVLGNPSRAAVMNTKTELELHLPIICPPDNSAKSQLDVCPSAVTH